ncbi:MAG: DUF1992 domain-containing protein [Candidatus Binatia bacterium]
MDMFSKIAETRIREAIERGELDDLSMRGKPLVLEDLSRVPPDLRVGYMILKRANVLPQELELRKELLTLQDLIDCCDDEGERRGLRKRMNERLLHYRVIRERRLHGPAHAKYGRKIRSRLGL